MVLVVIVAIFLRDSKRGSRTTVAFAKDVRFV
jgi:hypothetical protein